MKLKWIINSFAITLFCIIALLGMAHRDAAFAAEGGSAKIEKMLWDRFTIDGKADYIVSFTKQADLSAAYSMDWISRGEFVYNTLRKTADNSQGNAKAILDALGLRYQTFIVGNELYVWSGNQVSASKIAALPEVNFIRATQMYSIEPFIKSKPFANLSWPVDFLASNALTNVELTNATTDWGIIDTKANQAWSLGARGAGIKVANIDTGVQWNHPALVNQFACPGQPSNADCWYDPENVCGGSACDNNGHGTHTMGTMVAKDDPSFQYIAGMAPDATWIACKGCATDQCSDYDLNACADWIIAPGGHPIKRPNVVNNSWGGAGNNAWFKSKVQTWVADGIFPAFSAGNNAGCSSLGSPGDYQESFGSTAHDVSRAHWLSQGPSAFGHDPYTKPNISAPGISICSTVPTNNWNCISGTSMASPHSAGAVTQVWSVCPALRDKVYQTFELLQTFADPPDPVNPVCGVPPDQKGTYEDGYGYLNVLNAVKNCLGSVEYGTLKGHVYDQLDMPVAGVYITAKWAVEGNRIDTITDSSGFYTMQLISGLYDVTASKVNYTPQTINGVVVTGNQTTTLDFSISSSPGWKQIVLPSGCPDWTRDDGEYFPLTGLVYLMGGRTGASYSTVVGNIISFNPVTRACVDTGQVMPTPISNYTIVLLNNGVADLLCTFGGVTSSGANSNAVQCYNPLNNTISAVSTLPGAVSAYIPGGEAAVDNIAYVFGGFRSNTSPYHTSQTWAYDPVANSWTQKGDLTLARGYIDVAVADGIIFSFGGAIYDGTSLAAQTIAESFDPTLGTWSNAALADLPQPTAEGRAFGFGTDSDNALTGKIVIAGGLLSSNETSEVAIYNISSNRYDYNFRDLNTARRDMAGFYIPGNPGVMWVFGGRSGSDNQPFAPPEYYDIYHIIPVFLPILKN